MTDLPEEANMRFRSNGAVNFEDAELEEEIFRVWEGRSRILPTGLPDNPNATGKKASWSGDRERPGLNEEVSERPGEKREKAHPALPASLTWMTGGTTGKEANIVTGRHSQVRSSHWLLFTARG